MLEINQKATLNINMPDNSDNSCKHGITIPYTKKLKIIIIKLSIPFL